jgi:Pregnancy-associated plasma protein-A
MKRIFIAFTALVLFGSSCTKSNLNEPSNEAVSNGLPTERKCSSNEVLQQKMQEDPTLEARMNQIEEFTKQVETARLLPDGTIEIPVVVNVLYKTAAENISAAQIQSQIDILNQDFAATNVDYNNTPALFQGVRSGNTGIKFVLDQVIRKSTTKSSWRTDDAMKKSNRGGIDPTSPSTKLNLWVCTLSGGILGYAQFPGGSLATDGVVILNTALGNTGTAAAPFNKGRTATHEVGHYLNLRHIWGDATCGNDQVGDTPQHNTSNFGCPSYPHLSTCAGTPVEMTMNYMDYTDDACMYMFSAGQKTRMLAVFAVGGPRNSMAQP